MKRSISLWQAVGFGVTALGGTLLHYLYDWIGRPWIAPFSGVNESTWEHMKLLFWPLFLFAIVEGFFFGDRADFRCVKLRGTLLGLALIPVLFYTYNGAIGRSPTWFNIAVFFIAAAAAFLYETHLFRRGTVKCRRPALAFGMLCALGLLFVIFTFYTPRLPLFRDPLTGTYGIAP